MTRMLSCIGCLLLWLSTTHLNADGVIRDGLGARSSGRGGTNIAFADNGVVLLDNPAGLAFIDGTRLDDVGTDVLFTDLHYEDAQNTYTGAVDNPFPAGQLSFIRRVPCTGITCGVGLFAPAGFSSEYELNGPPQLPGRRHYKSIGSMAKILPGAAWQATPRLSLGGTLGVAVNHMELEGPYILQSPTPFQGTPTILDLQTTGAALSWSAGMQYQLAPATMLGVSYQSRTKFNLDGNARIETELLGRSHYDAELDVKWPRSLGIGLRQELCPHRVLAVDVIWFDWSDAYDLFALRLREPANPVYGAVVPRIRDEFPLRWHDSVSVRCGFEQRLAGQRVVRMGYSYHRNPIPDSTLTLFIQSTLQHAFSLGYGWNWRGYEVDVAYQYGFGEDRHVGTSDVLGGDFENSRVGTQVHWLYISFLRRS